MLPRKIPQILQIFSIFTTSLYASRIHKTIPWYCIICLCLSILNIRNQFENEKLEAFYFSFIWKTIINHHFYETSKSLSWGYSSLESDKTCYMEIKITLIWPKPLFLFFLAFSRFLCYGLGKLKMCLIILRHYASNIYLLNIYLWIL